MIAAIDVNPIVTPLVGVVPAQPSPLNLPAGSQFGEYTAQFAVVDANNNPVTLTGRTLEMQFYSALVPSVTLFSLTSSSGLTVSGGSTLAIVIPPARLQFAGLLAWKLWDVTNSAAPVELLQGTLPVDANPAP